MNKLLCFILSIAVFVTPVCSAADLIGHIDFNTVITAMPEYKKVELQLSVHDEEHNKTLKAMQQEIDNKRRAYDAGEKSFSDYDKFMQLQEIRALQARADEFVEKAQGSYQLKQRELLKPLAEKAKKAIDQVAKERGLAYVLDTTDPSILFFKDSNDISQFVKQKLGAK